MSAKRARLDNVELAFEDVGTGPALLLIHAGICDRRMWRPQFEAWASRYRMIAPDLRGCGDSSLPPGPFRHDVDLARLLDHLGIDKVAAIGVSMGGEVALGLALAFRPITPATHCRAVVLRGHPQPDYHHARLFRTACPQPGHLL